ncbi:hypothetical protein AB0O07_01175 [Streptomyces sp. NPDC093085]|uniref:hypothetical protein n=1 Tax=Streptomyces sp. NPDC093085 TaxID=3155068 RepID=UPI0034325FF8
MITDRGVRGGVVGLDLRHRGDPADAPDALHGEVGDALARTGRSEVRRFLVLDDATELVAHQLLYERLYAYGPAQVLCLAQGGGEERALRRPYALTPPTAGVLWIPDPFAGAGGRDGGPVPHPEETDDALRPLVELLADVALFDTVLGEVGGLPHSVAVPAVQVLEHDLTEEARTRAWRQALENLAGQDIPPPALVGERLPGQRSGGYGSRTGAGSGAPDSGAADSVPAALARFLGDAPVGPVAEGSCLAPGGPAEAARLACDRALRDAEDGYEQVRRPAALVAPRPRVTDLPERLETVGETLGRYRDTVAGALSDGGGDRLRPEQRTRLLKRGIRLPELPEAPRADVGPGLRTYTERLLAHGLPLRSVAARLGALSDLSAPAGSAARLARLDEICSGRRVIETAVPPPFVVRGSLIAHTAPVALLACAAGLWPLFGWVLGPLVGFAAAVLTLLMMRRRPSRTHDGRLDGGGSTRSGSRLVAGLAGGLCGALAGQWLAPPLWAGAAGLVVGVAGLGVLVTREWTVSVDQWWRETGSASAARALAGIDALLAETVVHDWLFAEARYHCSDGARAVALMVRDLAETVEEHLASAQGRGARRAAGAHRTAHAAEREPGHRPGTAASGTFERADPGESPADSWSWDSWGESTAPAAADLASGSAFTGRATAEDGRTDAWTDPWTGRRPDIGAGAGTGHRDPRGTGTESELPLEYLPAGDPWSGPPADPPWLDREWGDGGPALLDTLLTDLGHGVRALLAGRWAAVERDPVAAGRVSLRGPLGDVLDEEYTVLLRDGATSAPHFAQDPETRPGAAELLGVAADRAARLVAAADGTDDTVALCAAEDRRLLSKDRTAIRRIGFAPEALRRSTDQEAGQDSGAGPGTGGEEIVWTPGGRHAGVLRLIPLRAEIVRTVRAEQGEAP